MPAKSRKLQVVEKHRRVVELALSGKHPDQIAEEVGLKRRQIENILDKALEDSLRNFQLDAQRLLARKYMQVDMVVTSIMEKVMDEEGNDRIAYMREFNRLVNTQIKMLQRSSGSYGGDDDEDEDDPENYYDGSVLSTASGDYKYITEMAQNDPDYEIVAPALEDVDDNSEV